MAAHYRSRHKHVSLVFRSTRAPVRGASGPLSGNSPSGRGSSPSAGRGSPGSHALFLNKRIPNSYRLRKGDATTTGGATIIDSAINGNWVYSTGTVLGGGIHCED